MYNIVVRLCHFFLFVRKANLVLLTLFYSTLLALTHRQTDRLMDRGTTTLTLRGLEEPAHASRGLFLTNTLLLYPSLSPHSQTDGHTDRDTRFAWAGGTCPRFAWAARSLLRPEIK